MRRLVWIGVGVAVTVIVVRKGRALLDAYAPAGTADAVAGASRLAVALAGARRDFVDAVAEREAQLRHDLVGDVDVDQLREDRGRHVEDLRHAWSTRGGRPERPERPRHVPADWAGPTEDPDDDGEAAFF